MNRTLLLVATLAVPALAANRTETRAISAFHAIDVSGGVHLIINAGASPALVISGDEKAIGRYRTEVKGETLVIEPTERTLREGTGVTVTVTTRNLDALEASGGVEVSLEGGTAERLSVDLSGGVEVTANALSLESLAVQASGGVRVHLGGAARRATYETSGGVDVDAAGLSVGQVKVDASGGCTLSVRATDSIEGDASGAVDLRVSGNPAKSRVHTLGGAGVEYVKG